jgi:dihydropteroate synthase
MLQSKTVLFDRTLMTPIADTIKTIDDQLSKREIALDPAGYFIIYLDREANLICAKHFTNIINEQGLAVDPETGKVIPARGKVERTAQTLYTARTAKELCVKIFEQTQPCPVGFLDHAAYLGREFVRAQDALIGGEEYIQD